MENIVIFGYGLEGKSAEKYLKQTQPDANITIYDDYLPQFTQKPDWTAQNIIIKSPGVPRKNIPKQFWSKITTPSALFFEKLKHLPTNQQKPKIIAVTGTKGKSTTTNLIYQTLKNANYNVQIAGNIGIGFLDLLLEPNLPEFLVCELSSYQLEDISDVNFEYVVCTNLMADHLDRYKDIHSYQQTKAQLWESQTDENHFFFPKKQANHTLFHLGGGQKYACPPITNYFIEKSDFKAPHWAQNFGMVHKICQKLDISDEILTKTIKALQSLPHRLQKVAEIDEKIFISDTISTTPDSTLAAIKAFEANLGGILLGGQNRHQDFTKICQKLDELVQKTPNNPIFVIIPPTEVKSELLKAFTYTKCKIITPKTEKEGILYAKTYMQPQSVFLLSPAAPSYDHFKNFLDRGEHFKKIIQEK